MIASGHAARNWSLALLVNLMFAAQFPAYKVAADSMGIGALNLWTFVIATVIMLPFLIRARRAAPAPLVPRLRLGRQYFLLGLLGLIPPSVLLSWGVAHSTASNGAILALTIPVMMVIMGMIFLGERPGRFYLVSLALALIGTVLISWRDLAGGNFTGGMLAGNAAIFAGATGSAFYNSYGKKIMMLSSELELLVYGYLWGIALCVPISLLYDPQPFYQVTAWPLKAWIGVAILGLASWGLAMIIWMWLLNRLTVTQISVSVYLLPVLGVALSAITLGERLTGVQLAGGLVVLAAAFASSAQHKPQPA